MVSIHFGFALWSLYLFDGAASFRVIVSARRATSTTLRSSSDSASAAARDLLYQDQQETMLRRALHEQELLAPRTKELLAPKLPKSKAGTGFGSVPNPAAARAAQLATVLRRDGVVRVNGVLSDATAHQLRTYVLEQQRVAAAVTERDESTSRVYYGVENRRASRCDLQLSLQRGGFAAYDNVESMDAYADDDTATPDTFPLADALQELLGATNGTLRPLYEQLVTLDGELYELAAVITQPGSHRQMVHPDLPYQATAPLYVVFVALQTVTVGMGPTCFLLHTHSEHANAVLKRGTVAEQDALLATSDCRLSTLQTGDAVVFDARTLHCGQANTEQTRVLFNFSFRNPLVTGSLGYEGSLRPGYQGALSLRTMMDALDAYAAGEPHPFAQYH